MTSTTTNSQVIVSVGPCECHEVETVHASHRNFPEVKGEGETETHALERLSTQLTLALEHVPSGHGHEAIEEAMNDVREFRAGR